MATREQTEQTEHVLVVPTLLFHELGHFQGFSPRVELYLNTLLDPSYTSYRPRDQVEDDPSFKQLIPYCILRFAGTVFHYKRGTEQGEVLLQSKRSIGIGGHISAKDTETGGSAYREGLRREIEEELYIDTTYAESCVGLINDDETEVGKVHLGVVHIFDLDQPKVRPRESSIIDTGFADPVDLIDCREQFESWSQICLDHLFGARPT